MKNKIEKSGLSVDLVCLGGCGNPAKLFLFDGKWCIGHKDTMCGPIISHVDANKVLEKYIEEALNGEQ